MVNKVDTKLRRTNSRHTIYLKKGLVDDSAFPFEAGEPLIIRILGDKLIIEKKKD